MDKITKFLLKLGDKQRSILLIIIQKILENNIEKLDITSLKGEENLFRIRKGQIRIIFKKTDHGNKIIDLNYRGSIY